MHRQFAARHCRLAQPPVLLALGALAIAGCGAPPASPIEIAGTERLGWDQRAASQAELASLHFRLVIDDAAPVALAGVTCGTLGRFRTVACTAPLPDLPPGQHALALIAVNGQRVESSRSSPLPVVVTRPRGGPATGPVGSVLRSAVRGSPITSGTAVRRDSDTPTLTVQTVATGFVNPTDLALLPDGRILVAERAGTIQAVNRGIRQTAPALELPTTRDGALLAVAVDPEFARTGYVYTAYATATEFHVTRFREAAGTFADPVTVLDGIPASADPTAALRFGPDGKLYVAFDDGGDPSAPGDLGSYNGKVLRLNVDGTVPGDQPGYSPVLVPNVVAPRSLTWAVPDGRLWMAEGRTAGTGMLNVVDPGTPAANGAAVRARARIVSRHVPPAGQVPFSILAYRGALVRAWTDDLLMTIPAAQQIVRITPDHSNPTRVASTTVVASGPIVGPVGAMAVDAEGMVYVLSGDRLLTLAPMTASSLP